MIEVVHQLEAVRREVAGGSDVHTVRISQSYDAAVEDVWDACTTAERIARWFLPVTGELRLGGRYQLEGNAGGVVEECDPPHRFVATWEYGETVSRITVQVVPEGDSRTRLVLEHTVPDDEHWARFGPGAVGVGWDFTLLGLSMHLRSGEPVDREAVAAWMATEDSVRFTTESGQGWRQAHLAAGADAAAAEDQARRTIEAYTGA